jgi:hypothetical protein
MNNELEMIWKKAIVVYFKVQRHLPGGDEEIYEEPQPGYPDFGLRFEPGTSRIWSRLLGRYARYNTVEDDMISTN